MALESVWAHSSEYLFNYLLEVLFHTVFHVLLSISHIVLLTYLECYLVDNYTITAFTIEYALTINFFFFIQLHASFTKSRETRSSVSSKYM